MEIFPKTRVSSEPGLTVWLKYRNYDLSYSWLSSQSPPAHPPPVILESQSIIAHQSLVLKGRQQMWIFRNLNLLKNEYGQMLQIEKIRERRGFLRFLN